MCPRLHLASRHTHGATDRREGGRPCWKPRGGWWRREPSDSPNASLGLLFCGNVPRARSQRLRRRRRGLEGILSWSSILGRPLGSGDRSDHCRGPPWNIHERLDNSRRPGVSRVYRVEVKRATTKVRVGRDGWHVGRPHPIPQSLDPTMMVWPCRCAELHETDAISASNRPSTLDESWVPGAVLDGAAQRKRAGPITYLTAMGLDKPLYSKR